MKNFNIKKWMALALCLFSFAGLARSEGVSKAAPQQVEKIDALFSAEEKERIEVFESNVKEQKRLYEAAFISCLPYFEAERSYYLFSLDLLRLKKASASEQNQIDLLEKYLIQKLHGSWNRSLMVVKMLHEKGANDLSAYLRVQMDYQLFCLRELSKNKK